MVENIRPYNAEEFEKSYSDSFIARRLASAPYTKVVWEDTFKQRHTETITSRHHAFQRIMYMATFYYLEMLQDKRPKVVYDLGCGANIFKKYFTNVK